MADPQWFTDADVDAVERVIHDEVDLNGHRWTARAVLASLAPRIAQERADAWDEGSATALDFAYLNDDRITLRLEKPNPYRAAALEREARP